MPKRRNRLDDAARAGWLYYVAGNTQDQIAATLGVSRQSAQRLVSLAVSEKLVRVRIEHPIANCLSLAQRMRDKFGLRHCEITPSDPGSDSAVLGIAEAAAAEIERVLSRAEPLVMGLGTGRTLKAAVEQLPAINCPQHKVVSLTGNISTDGSAAYFNVIFTMADVVKAPSFPMPLPVIVSSPEERALLHGQKLIAATLDLAARADVTFVGIGEFDASAPLIEDRFITEAEQAAMRLAGAVGEIVGWAFDRDGRIIEGGVNARVASAPIPDRETALVIAVAMGRRKQEAIAAAVRGGLVNGLITDERTAEALLAL